MPTRTTLANTSNADLMCGLRRVLADSNRISAEMLLYLGEVDARRLYLDEACPSMFAYCTEVLYMSESAAYKRICAARAARSYPLILGMVASGDLHLTGITLLAPHLTEDSHRDLLANAKHKGKRAIQHLLAEQFPKPDAPSLVRKVPRRTNALETQKNQMSQHNRPTQQSQLAQQSGSHQSEQQPRESQQLEIAQTPRAVVVPTSADRYKVQFTATQQLHDKLREAQTLLRHQIPDGDVATVIDRALTELLVQVKRKRFAATKRRQPSTAGQATMQPPVKKSGQPTMQPPVIGSMKPETAPEEPSEGVPRPRGRSRGATPQPAAGVSRTSTNGTRKKKRRSRHIPNTIKRAVIERDGARCAFVDAHGRRCRETGFLEFHHADPFAMGGQTTIDNISVRCRAHNQHAAQQDFGSKYIDGKIRQRTSPQARQA